MIVWCGMRYVSCGVVCGMWRVVWVGVRVGCWWCSGVWIVCDSIGFSGRCFVLYDAMGWSYGMVVWDGRMGCSYGMFVWQYQESQILDRKKCKRPSRQSALKINISSVCLVCLVFFVRARFVWLVWF